MFDYNDEGLGGGGDPGLGGGGTGGGYGGYGGYNDDNPPSGDASGRWPWWPPRAFSSRDLPDKKIIRTALMEGCQGSLAVETEFDTLASVDGTVDVNVSAIAFSNCSRSRFLGGDIHCEAFASCRRKGLLVTYDKSVPKWTSLSFSQSLAAAEAVAFSSCDGSTAIGVHTRTSSTAKADNGRTTQEIHDDDGTTTGGLYETPDPRMVIHDHPTATASAHCISEAAHFKGLCLVHSHSISAASEEGGEYESQDSEQNHNVTESYIS